MSGPSTNLHDPPVPIQQQLHHQLHHSLNDRHDGDARFEFLAYYVHVGAWWGRGGADHASLYVRDQACRRAALVVATCQRVKQGRSELL